MDNRFEEDPGASSSSAHYEEQEGEEAELKCDSLGELIAFNAAYCEVIDTAMAEVQKLKNENLEKQRLLREELRRLNGADMSKRKIPVNMYMPPYFKDENGMCPPMSTEARAKLEKKWFDPLMKEEKKWTPAELKTLREGVRDALIANMLQPICSKRDVLTQKLRNVDVNTTQAERSQWTIELEDIMRKIEYVRGKKEAEVLTAAADYSVVPWNEIANVNFKGTRTEWAVRSKWMNELNPKWNKSPWSSEELEKLRDLRESPRFISWPMLAVSLGTKRTAFQCLEKYKTDVVQHSKEWSQEEDQKLITLTNLLATNGMIQWDKVAQFMPGRTRQQCRTRFSHTLDTSVKHGRWTDQEDLLLICSVGRLGAKDWAKVAQAVPGRNDSQCRERWCNVLNRPASITDRFTLAEDERLLYAVKLFGKGNWAKCSTLLPKKTAKQLRNRYIQLVAAKLKMVAGFCTAVEAMDGGKRPNDEEEKKEVIEEDSIAPNEVMRKGFARYSEFASCQDTSAEEMIKRLNEGSVNMSKRYRRFKEMEDWASVKLKFNEALEKKVAGASVRTRSEGVLQALNITDIDIRYMVEKSNSMMRYYRTRQMYCNVDQAGCRVRPIKDLGIPSYVTTFPDEVPEKDRVMGIVEALCAVVRMHDSRYWGKVFYKKQFEPFRQAREYCNEMLSVKAIEVANHKLSEDPTPIPINSTLAPTSVSVKLLEVLERARGPLNQLASKHFYPIEIGLDEQKSFNEEKRAAIDKNTRLNIRLSDEITKSPQYAIFQAQMRTLLLEPYRLKIAKESSADEARRLENDLWMQQRAVEEETVVDGSVTRQVQQNENNTTTAEKTQNILTNGIHLDLTNVITCEVSEMDSKKAIGISIDEVVDAVRKRAREENGDMNENQNTKRMRLVRDESEKDVLDEEDGSDSELEFDESYLEEDGVDQMGIMERLESYTHEAMREGGNVERKPTRIVDVRNYVEVKPKKAVEVPIVEQVVEDSEIVDEII